MVVWERMINDRGKTQGSVQTTAAMVTSPSYTLIGEHEMGERKPLRFLLLY